ncbi:MAG: hypothetical protein OXE42_20385 [Gammaproteobacteria bacterium]|nr:hypothetical protein [Gammaproteobacteria bacterium]
MGAVLARSVFRDISEGYRAVRLMAYMTITLGGADGRAITAEALPD